MSTRYGFKWNCLWCGWVGDRNEIAKEPKMRHGSEKEEFETGAKRDTSEGKGRPSLISPVLIHRLGVLLEKGAKHYDADNWMKGMPFRRTMDSIIRHGGQWLAGDKEEDHLAAMAFGIMCLMHYEEIVAHPGTSVSDLSTFRRLDDRCVELRKILPSILTTPEPDATLESKGPESCPFPCCEEGPKPFGWKKVADDGTED